MTTHHAESHFALVFSAEPFVRVENSPRISPVGTPDVGILAKLPDDAHFPGGILANTNWLVPIFELPPAPVPVNHGHKTGKGGRNRLKVAVLHPDTEPRRMFSFIDAGGWFAHFTRSWELRPP